MMIIVNVALCYLGHYLEDSCYDIVFENKLKVTLKELLSKIITWRYLVCLFLKCLFFLSPRKGANRYLTVRKKNGSELKRAVMTCALTPGTKHVVCTLIRNFPVTNKERTELLPKTEQGNAYAVEPGMFSVSCQYGHGLVNQYYLKKQPTTQPQNKHLYFLSLLLS